MLELSLSHDRVTPIPASLVYHLVLELPTFEALNYLWLNLSFVGVLCDEIAEALCKACAGLSGLRRLRLDLSGNALCDMEAGINALGQSPVLEELWLSLARNPLGASLTKGGAVVAVIADLPRQLVRLNQLNIDLSDCGLAYASKLYLHQCFHSEKLPSACRVTIAFEH